MKIKLTLLTCLFFNFSFAQWTQISDFEGGQVNTFLKYNNMLLAGTEGGIYKADAPYGTWNYLSEDYKFPGVTQKARSTKILASGSNIYSLWGAGIARSTDNGNTWQDLDIADSLGIMDFTLVRDTLYFMGFSASGTLRIYRSSDNGDSFVQGAAFTNQFAFLVQMASVNNKLFFLIPDFANGDSIKTSTDGMSLENFSLTGIPANSQLSDLAGDGSNLYINMSNFNGAFINTVYQYNGVAWSDIGAGIPAQSQLFNLIYTGNALYTTMFDGASFTVETYTLANGGTNWTKLAGNGLVNRFVSRLISVGADSLMCSVQDDSGVFFSSDNGENWVSRNTGLRATRNYMVKGTTNTNIIALSSRNVSVSTDNGNTFTVSNTGLTPGTYVNLKKNSNAIYVEVLNPNSIFYSTTNGASWSQLPYPTGVTFYSTFSPTDNGLYLTAFVNNQVTLYYSANQGALWTNITSNIPSDIDLNQLFKVSGDQNNLYLAGRTTTGVNRIYRSSDNGTTYTSDQAGFPASFLNPGSGINQMVYTGSNFYIVVTDAINNTDSLYIKSGNTWTSLFGRYNPDNAFVIGNQVISYFTHSVYEVDGAVYTIMYDTIYRSQDNGATWSVEQTGLYPAVRPLSLMPTPTGLFTTTYEHGVWKNSQLVNGTDQYHLMQAKALYNFPNPASAYTVISYYVPKSGNVELALFDAQGKKVRQLMNEAQTEGSHTLQVAVSGLKPGVYFYQLKTSNSRQAGKLVVR